MLRSGAPWRDLPGNFRPFATCYNRFVRRRRCGQSHLRARRKDTIGPEPVALTAAMPNRKLGAGICGSRYHPRRTSSRGVSNVNRSVLLAAVCASALVAASAASAKTLAFCSEGSPKNFSPAVNTTGTSFDANEPVYNRIVEFERGSTKVVPGLAEKWTISEDGTVYTFSLRKGVKWHSSRTFKPTRDFNADDVLFSIDRQWKQDQPHFKVTSQNHSYFDGMAMPKLLKSVEKFDDYTIKITLN